MVKVKTTQSGKRYTYQSFRERVDSIKIEPSKDLKTRAFDEVESSHFLSSLERWSEFNRSGVFTSFIEDVDGLVQSLPQILHYKSKIFDLLVLHISKHDKLSLQPLLELLTQFCHDLGPDFMEFYEKSVTLISDTVLDLEANNSDTLEWAFNSLAFIFKYLSKILTKDLIPTFDLLAPLMHSKEYIGRFSAEALSFLVRKSNLQNLQNFTDYAFNKIDNDDQYTQAVTILFTEALKSTQGSIHSKSTTILGSLLDKTSSSSSSSAFCDIVLNIINYGSKESVESIYELIFQISSSKLEDDKKFLANHLRILTVLIFADSGRKVPSWKLIIDSINSVISQINIKELEDESKYLFVHLLSIFTRNCEFQDLTRSHTSLYRFALSLGSLFLPFILNIINLAKERALKLAGSFIQEFINEQWKGNEEVIAFFIQDLNKRDLITKEVEDISRFRVKIPSSFSETIYKSIKSVKLSESKDLYQIYWRLSLLENSTHFEEDTLRSVLSIVQSFDNDSKFKLTIESKIISLFISYSSYSSSDFITVNFKKLYKEIEFIKASAKHFKLNKDDSHSEEFITLLSTNLCAADHDLRSESLVLIGALSNDEEMSEVANQCLIIEQIPTDLANGRDIGIRVRNLAIYVKNLDGNNDLKSQVYFNFLFGLLTIKFSPSWDGVFASLPDIYHKNPELVWKLAFKFISNGQLEKELDYFDFISGEFKELETSWRIYDVRFNSVINISRDNLTSYSNCVDSILKNSEESYKERAYPTISRANSIKALKTVPAVSESHSSELVTIVLDNIEEDEDIEEYNFSKSERNSIIDLFTTFKKLNKVARAEELKLKFLRLLSSRAPEIRKTALNCLLNFNIKHLNKYKDNLNNLLDDKLFRDEISKIFSKNDDSVVEEKDMSVVAPLILRILFGRAQNNNSNSSKKGLKFGSINILASMDTVYILDFLKIATEKIYSYDDEIVDYDDIQVESITTDVLRRNLGFNVLLTEIISTLGEKFTDVLAETIKPLLLTMVNAQIVISSKSDDSQLNLVSRNVRQTGTKNLSLLFNLLSEHSWDDHIETIYEKVLSPRFEHFEDENLQQASSLLRIFICWTQHKSYYELLLINKLEPALKVISLLGNSNTKPEVLSKVFEFSMNIIKNVPKTSKYEELRFIVADKNFECLPDILTRSTDPSLNAEAVALLLLLVENKHVETQDRRLAIVNLSTQLLEKPNAQLSKDSRLEVLKCLIVLIKDFEGGFEGIKHLYEVSSRFLKFFSDRRQRELLVDLFREIGDKFDDYAKACSIIEETNAYSKRGMNEFDYDRRLSAYRELNETLYKEFSYLEWLPIINNSLFFINEEDDLSIRSNASYSLRRYVDSFSEREHADKDLIHTFKDLVLPNIRVGLRSKVEVIQTEFITILAHIVSNVKHVEGFDDMKVLLFNNKEDINFFLNINHIQLHRRQRAVKRLAEYAHEISGNNISHYLLPIIEHYAYCTDEKLRNIANEAVTTIEYLISCVSFRQYQAIFKRYQAGLKEGSETLKDSVSLIVTISKALLQNVRSEDHKMEGLPTGDLRDVQVEKEMIEPIAKILNKRNEETAVDRSPLIEALASLILCLSHARVVSILPGVLTNICQILRTRYDDLREATRKYLGRASNILGATYIRFIINELKTALAKGFQVHVLGYTVNYILNTTTFEHGELDESAPLIMHVIMENIFGTTGQDKENDGYRTTMKEVKNNKSYDSAELLGRLISLSHFNDIVNPFKMLLQERITFKIQSKIDELLRRFALGVYKNDQLKTQDMLVLCYELFAESEKDFSRPQKAEASETEKHFLVELDSKPLRVETENTLYLETFQKFGLELLRTTLQKTPEFINEEKLSGFLPQFEKALKSDNETIIVGVLRILSLIINVDFDSIEEGDIYKTCARRCLRIIKDYPSTESEIVQACFKYLSTVLRHRQDLTLKENSLGYLLVRIQPDLNEQSRQGLAFNFIKSLVSKHVMIPEVYDTMDKIREVMVTSHSKERRDVSRSIYFQFIMEYDQGRGRLEKQLKFLVDNLSYPADEGKNSVMELIHLILNKSNKELLEAISTSFFVGLSKVLISETSTKTREMAISLITTIFERMGTETFEKYIIGWLNAGNSSLLKCSLQLYRVKLKVSGVTGSVDEQVITAIKDTLIKSRADSKIEISWELVYASLNCLSIIGQKNIDLIDEALKEDIISCLLYPHSWIRLASSRLIGLLLNKEGILDSSDIQNIMNRLFHQLRAPSIDEALGSQTVKSLTLIFMNWEKSGALFDYSLLQKDDDDLDGDEEEETEENKEVKASNWAIKQASGLVRTEKLSLVSKKCGIQFLAMTLQILSSERILELSDDFVLPLYLLIDNNDTDEELSNLSSECLKMIENKIGTTEYTQVYSRTRQFVYKRRQDRRAKRARLVITAPEAAARRKIKKHDRTREKRKHEKDANGFYHTKKKKRV